jgi:hypothetical protein
MSSKGGNMEIMRAILKIRAVKPRMNLCVTVASLNLSDVDIAKPPTLVDQIM